MTEEKTEKTEKGWQIKTYRRPYAMLAGPSMRPLYHWKGILLFVLLFSCAGGFLVHAEDVPAPPSYPDHVYRAVVLVQCDQRQGSGTVINGNEGYVLTNAHVVLSVETGKPATSCVVGFSLSSSTAPTIYYRASVVRSAYSTQRNYDFAILQVTEPLTKQELSKPFPFLKTNEFAVVGEPVHVIGYSGGQNEMRVRSGMITDFQSGYVETTAHISPGDSGGAALDAQGGLIGIPTRVVTLTTASTQEQSVSLS